MRKAFSLALCAASLICAGCGSSEPETIDFVVTYVREDWEPLAKGGECTSLVDPDDSNSPRLLPKVGDSFGIEIGSFLSRTPGVMSVGQVLPHFDGAPGTGDVCVFTFSFVGFAPQKERFLSLYVPSKATPDLPYILDAPFVDLDEVRTSNFEILLTRETD